MLPICVTMEFRKLRHSHLWLVFLVIPLIPTVMGAGNYLNNLGMLKSEWYSLWTQCSKEAAETLGSEFTPKSLTQ